MRASRELDLIIAEKLFGLSVQYIGGGESTPVTAAQVLANFQHIDSIPCFSTDISAAWPIIDKFRRDGPYKLVIQAYAKDKFWTIKAYHPDGYSKSCTTSAETMPLAICLAALKAAI